MQPVPAIGDLLYTAAAPRAFVLLPAGHSPGLYNCEIVAFNTVVAGAGNYSSVLSWDQLGFGPATLVFGNVSLTATGLGFSVLRTIESSGESPIIWTATPAGVTGTPNVRISTTTQFIATPVP